MTNIESFITKAIMELIDNGFSVNFTYDKKVSIGDNDPDPCEGYLQDNPYTLNIATKYPTERWQRTFLHEYCHFKQTIEKTIIVKRFNNVWRGKDANEIIGSWIKGKSISKVLLAKCFERVKDLELDCEKRVVKLIKTYDLEIDIDDYIRGANCYVLFYNLMAQERKWYKNDPSYIEELKNLVPSCFVADYSYDLVSENFYKLMKRKCL